MLTFNVAPRNAFTIFLADFALTMTYLPNTSLFPAFVAGLPERTNFFCIPCLYKLAENTSVLIFGCGGLRAFNI